MRLFSVGWGISGAIRAHMSQITFSQALQGYLLAVGACHLSAHPIRDYVNTFNEFIAYPGEDIAIEDITFNRFRRPVSFRR